jgi:hypothetical protein
LHDALLQVIHLSGARDERLVADNYRREKSRPTSPPFIIEWKKFTVPPILS